MVIPWQDDALFVAISTPFTENGNLNESALHDLVLHYLERGVEGIYCAGSSGEGLLLSIDERKRLTRVVVDTAAGAVPVVAHVGTLATADACKLGRAAADDGATAVSVIPPIYYSLPASAVRAHVSAVMDASGLPMILYNVPALAGSSFDSTDSLLLDERIVAIKHTSRDLFMLERLARDFPRKALLSGHDETYFAAVAAGANGAVGTTVGVQLELFAAIRRAYREGDYARARLVQSWVNDTVRVLLDNDFFPAAKFLAALDSINLGQPRQPLQTLGDSQRVAVAEAFKRLVDYRKEAGKTE